jgi:hypothetical protein
MAERRGVVAPASQEQEQARRLSLLLDRAWVRIDAQGVWRYA